MRLVDASHVAELITAPCDTFFNTAELFGREAPLHVDLGCGDGSFLRAVASQRPETNFLGVERLLRRVRSSSRKAAQLDNVRIIRAETLFVIHHLLPPESVDVFYLLFPDPWPKRRHYGRRLVTCDFLDVIWNRLATGGSLFLATDHEQYFASICQLLGPRTDFKLVTADWKLPASAFEQKFLAFGTTIHRLELRKISPVR
jgi:tRNA (guanine-N7-)-methyltransferase